MKKVLKTATAFIVAAAMMMGTGMQAMAGWEGEETTTEYWVTCDNDERYPAFIESKQPCNTVKVDKGSRFGTITVDGTKVLDTENPQEYLQDSLGDANITFENIDTTKLTKIAIDYKLRGDVVDNHVNVYLDEVSDSNLIIDKIMESPGTNKKWNAGTLVIDLNGEITRSKRIQMNGKHNLIIKIVCNGTYTGNLKTVTLTEQNYKGSVSIDGEQYDFNIGEQVRAKSDQAGVWYVNNAPVAYGTELVYIPSDGDEVTFDESASPVNLKPVSIEGDTFTTAGIGAGTYTIKLGAEANEQKYKSEVECTLDEGQYIFTVGNLPENATLARVTIVKKSGE